MGSTIKMVYGYITIAFIAFLFDGGNLIPKLIGGAALLLACYEIGKVTTSRKK